MIEYLANHIVEHDPMATVWRTRDTVHYIQAEWSKSHDEPIDEGELLLFLCDEHHGNLKRRAKVPLPPLPRRDAHGLQRGGVPADAV